LDGRFSNRREWRDAERNVSHFLCGSQLPLRVENKIHNVGRGKVGGANVILLPGSKVQRSYSDSIQQHSSSFLIKSRGFLVSSSHQSQNGKVSNNIGTYWRPFGVHRLRVRLCSCSNINVGSNSFLES